MQADSISILCMVQFSSHKSCLECSYDSDASSLSAHPYLYDSSRKKPFCSDRELLTKLCVGKVDLLLLGFENGKLPTFATLFYNVRVDQGGKDCLSCSSGAKLARCRGNLCTFAKAEAVQSSSSPVNDDSS